MFKYFRPDFYTETLIRQQISIIFYILNLIYLNLVYIKYNNNKIHF